MLLGEHVCWIIDPLNWIFTAHDQHKTTGGGSSGCEKLKEIGDFCCLLTKLWPLNKKTGLSGSPDIAVNSKSSTLTRARKHVGCNWGVLRCFCHINVLIQVKIFLYFLIFFAKHTKRYLCFLEQIRLFLKAACPGSLRWRATDHGTWKNKARAGEGCDCEKGCMDQNAKPGAKHMVCHASVIPGCL